MRSSHVAKAGEGRQHLSAVSFDSDGAIAVCATFKMKQVLRVDYSSVHEPSSLTSPLILHLCRNKAPCHGQSDAEHSARLAIAWQQSGDSLAYFKSNWQMLDD
jgi:hypothetical protein